jgi:alpha-beta hydrolase superfamily lysophospholipase
MSPLRQPWLPELLVSAAKASGIGYLAAVYAISRWLTRPTRGKPQQTPADFGIRWEPLACASADGFRLRGWVLTPPNPRATVELFHGVYNTRAQTLTRSVLLARAGYRCVAFDFRAHGESTGRRTSFGYHEGRDVAAVDELVRRCWPGQPRAALGISMGAAAVCFAARQTPAFDAVVLESLYRDIQSAFTNRLRSSYPPWFRRLGPGIVWMTERRIRVRMADVAPVEWIGHLAPAPVLLLTGTADPHAPPAEAEELLQRCRGPRELWLVPGAGHRDVFETAGNAYAERVLDFLERSLFRRRHLPAIPAPLVIPSPTPGISA